MGVTRDGFIPGNFYLDDDSGDNCRDIFGLDVFGSDKFTDFVAYFNTGYLPEGIAELLRPHIASISEASSKENSMDIKAVLAALESAGLQLTTQNLAPLVGQLIELGQAAAEKGISNLAHKAGVQDVTKAS